MIGVEVDPVEEAEAEVAEAAAEEEVVVEGERVMVGEEAGEIPMMVKAGRGR